jgi:hypothetical protein
VLIPRERVAHGLRRELLRAGYPEALAGTRFLTIAAAAAGVLQAGSKPFTAIRWVDSNSSRRHFG